MLLADKPVVVHGHPVGVIRVIRSLLFLHWRAIGIGLGRAGTSLGKSVGYAVPMRIHEPDAGIPLRSEPEAYSDVAENLRSGVQVVTTHEHVSLKHVSELVGGGCLQMRVGVGLAADFQPDDDSRGKGLITPRPRV